MSNAGRALETIAAEATTGALRRAAAWRPLLIAAAVSAAFSAAPCGAQIVVAEDADHGLLLVNEHSTTVPGDAVIAPVPAAAPATPKPARNETSALVPQWGPKLGKKPGQNQGLSRPGLQPTPPRLPALSPMPIGKPAPASGAASAGVHAASLGRRARIEPLIVASAIRHDLPVALLVAMVRVESNFDVNAESPKGAIGPMQLMPATARYLGVLDIRDPAANIDAGAKYIKQLLERFGNDLIAALAAYNAGPTVVARNGGQIPSYSETQHYVSKVIGHYHVLQATGGGPTY